MGGAPEPVSDALDLFVNSCFTFRVVVHPSEGLALIVCLGHYSKLALNLHVRKEGVRRLLQCLSRRWGAKHTHRSERLEYHSCQLLRNGYCLQHAPVGRTAMQKCRPAATNMMSVFTRSRSRQRSSITVPQ